MSGGFATQWLELREAVDAAARDQALLRRFAAALPRSPRILDLGTGTGAMARALAPCVGGAQHWLLAESDPAHLAAQERAMAAWMRRSGHGGVAWRFEPFPCDLGGAWDADADAVTASAFFDLVGAAWIERFGAWLARRRLPLLATLMVDGRRDYAPEDVDDAQIAAAFRLHQRRDKGLGPALGPDAAAALGRALRAHGFTVNEARSDWQLGPAARDLLMALVTGEAAAAREAGATADGWERRRLDAALTNALAAVIGHCDLLALPPQICENTGV